jgi:hypothetical protein
VAQLDSGRAPHGGALLAFVGDDLRAALPLDGGEAVADPFESTAELVDLLRLRAAQAEAPFTPRRFRHLSRLRLVDGSAA